MPPPPTAQDSFGFPARPPVPPRPPRDPISVETLLKWSGLLLVFLAAVFLVSTAIDRGWISPEMQLTGSAAIGGVLIAGGLYLRTRRTGWGAPLAAVGLTVLFVCARAGWSLELATIGLWLGATVAVHGLGLWLATRFGGPALAGTSVVVGTITALTFGDLSTARLTTAVPIAVAVIALTTMAQAAWDRRPSLHLWAVAAALPGFGVVALLEGVGIAALVSGVVVALAIWWMPVLFEVRPPVAVPQLASWLSLTRRLPLIVPSSVAWAVILVTAADPSDGGPHLIVGAIAAVLALPAFLGQLPRGQSLLGQSVAGRSLSSLHPAIGITQILGAMASITVGSAIMLDGPAFLVALVVQAAALLVLTRWVSDPLAELQSIATTSLAALVGLVRILTALADDLPVIDDLVHLGVIVLIGAWALVEPRKQLRLPLAVVAYLAAGLWAASALVHLPQGQGLVSAAWAGLGLAALLLGSLRPDGDAGGRLAVQGGLVTLAVVVGKLLTVDLVDVDVFWRVGLFFLLGGTFLAVSFRFGARLGSSSSEQAESERAEVD